MPPLTAALDRRDLLRLLAAGAATSLAGCGRPDDPIYPVAAAAEGDAPGTVRRYATALPLAGYLRGVTGLVVDGRPIKLEGLAGHPASRGATDVFTEVAILDLYDPQRLKAPLAPSGPASWDAAMTAVQTALGRGGDRAVVLTGRVTSPTLLARIAALQAARPGLRHLRWEPFDDDAPLAAARAAFGRPLTARPRFADADVLLLLDADPLGPGPDQVANARAWSERRRRDPMPRSYAAEASPSASGIMADRRIAAGPRDLAALCHALAGKLGGPASVPPLAPALAAFAGAAARDLLAARGRALVIAGADQPEAIHGFAAWANGVLAAPLDWIAPVDPDPRPHRAGLAALAAEMHAGRVETLIVLDANPAYAADPALGFAEAMRRVPLSLSAATLPNETGAAAKWQLALSHPLEAWHDGRAPDGTATLAQPLVRPFYDTRTVTEVVDLLADPAAGRRGAAALRESWVPLGEEGWRAAVAGAVVPDSAARPETVRAAPLVLPPIPAALPLVIVRPSPTLYDGRFAANAWAQECPDPLTKEVWGSSLRVSPADMARLDVTDGDLVTVTQGNRVTVPVRAMPGQADGVFTLLAGYGRHAAGVVPEGIGASGFALTPGRAAVVTRTGERAAVPSEQHQFALAGDLEKLFPVLAPGAAMPRAGEPPSLLPNPPARDNAPPQWAMAVDTDLCIGCKACVVACQAENNVPAIGPEEIAAGRTMHWLRVDRYETRDVSGFQPVPCMHCEKAPCEPVCPVEASVHDAQGLNQQVYNRCIGTRNCQANCPYKVRRFNFRDYADRSLWGDAEALSVTAQRNPDVTVRARGVMEKCTYCVQRIEAHNREADAGGQPGPVVTACQAACPTEAIRFGTLADRPHRRGACRSPPLRAAGGIRHEAAHHLSGASPRSRSGGVIGPHLREAAGRRWTLPSIASLGDVTEAIAAPLLDRRAGRAWWLAVLACLLLTLLGAVAIGFSFGRGVGLWGNNSAVVWGFPIANYVWWIGIGNAGTLISSLLLLTRQKWRASLNRMAEAMTLFAVSMAGIFPILHLGRPMYFYWLAPYPNTMQLWPQWRSALVWDFWAILSYLLFSIIFFYVGLVPDLATLRDRAPGRGWQRLYGVAAMGWQGTPRQWHAQERLHRTLAAVAVPLVCSVHSIVGLDFAASLMPGWTESIFPPYFVVGALFSGFAMVVLIALVLRRALGLEGVIVPAHFDAMAKIILAAAIVMGASYAAEWLGALWSGEPADLRLVGFEFAGHYAPLYWAMLLFNVGVPQLFWSARARLSGAVLVGVSLAVLVGMWLERILILLNTLSTGYEPSFWRTYAPTLVDFAILAGTIGAFVLLLLLFARVLPVVSMHEVRKLVAEEAR